jgi:hypothetical protein
MAGRRRGVHELLFILYELAGPHNCSIQLITGF